jgi:serine O-acetyltransferase
MVMEQENNPQVSSSMAEWQREQPIRFWDPGRKLLKAMRQYQKYASKNDPISGISAKMCVLRHRFWSVVTGADIPINAKIGGGLLIPHPNGIVIHPDAEIGVNCLIHQQVTIGTTHKGGLPHIKGHVDIGAGAKILGSITVDEHAIVGANAVVTKDVNAYEVVAGIPARVIQILKPE